MARKIGFIVLFLLIFCLAGCSSANRTTGESTGTEDTGTDSNNNRDNAIQAETGILTVTAGDDVLGTVSIEAIGELPDFKRTMTIRSTGGDSKHVFRGARLLDVLNLVDRNIVKNYSVVAAVGADNYLSEISMEEVLMENNVYIMYYDNEEPLLTKDGRPLGMRLIILQDEFGLRFTNYLTELALK